MKKTVLTLIFTLCVFFLNAQNHVVEGVVSDDTGETLPGVTVLVKGTKIGTTTDINGKYKIRLPIGMKTLVFSFIGMQTREIKVEGNKLDVTLSMDSKMLDEVVVVGYGGIKSKESLVGSIEQVSGVELMTERPIESIDKMLEGKIAGVHIEENSGDPAAPISIRIRGQSSLTQIGSNAVVASSEPLYVLDGVPLYDVSAPNETSFLGDVKINPLALINPEDIESISVLKDASASAIYGANASNGVIIITTKKGQAGKTRFSFSSNFGFQQPVAKFKYLNSEQYIELATEAINNSDLSAANKLDEIAALGSPDINTDWFDLVSQTGIVTKNTFSFSGGSKKHTYRFSVNYLNNRSIGKGNNLERISASLTVNSELNKKLKWDYSVTVSNLDKDRFGSFESIKFKPTLSPYNEDGSYSFEPDFRYLVNPLAALEQNEAWNKTFYVNGNTGLKYQIFDDLRAEGKFGVDYNSSENYVFYSSQNALGANRNGYISRSNRHNMKWIAYSQLIYNKMIKEDHHINTTVGYQIENRSIRVLRGTNSNLPFEKLKELGISEKEDASVNSSSSSNGSISYYGRLGYDYKGKYFTSFSFRNDRSSFFGGDAQADNFMSIGASWIISKENWFESLSNILSYLKIRTTYGSTGNSRIGTYAAFGLYTYSDRYMYDGIVGAQPSTAPNPHLSWEKNYKFNVALDFKLFDKVNVSVEHYINNIKGSISNLDITQTSGFENVPVNVADMRNSGWEGTISSTLIDKKDFSWHLNFNIASNKNIVKSLGNDTPQTSNLNYSSLGLFVGQDVNVILALQYGGVNSETGLAQYILPDGTITTETAEALDQNNRVFVGSSSPDFFGGLSTTIDYKQFSFSTSISYEWGGHKMMPWNAFDLNSDGRRILLFNQSVNQLDRWQQPGDITDVPKLSLNNPPIYMTTRNLFDKTNIRIKNISISYRLPNRIIEKLGIHQFTLTLNIDNIWTWHKDKSEPNRNGIAEALYTYPIARTYSLGLNVKF